MPLPVVGLGWLMGGLNGLSGACGEIACSTLRVGACSLQWYAF